MKHFKFNVWNHTMLLLCGMKELAMLHDLVSNATPMFNVAHPLSLGTEVAWHLNLNLRTILGNSMFGSRKERVKWFITAAITQTNTSLTFKLFYADISKFRHEISPRSSLQSSLGVNNTVQKQKSSLQLNSHLISPVSLPHHRKVFCLQRIDRTLPASWYLTIRCPGTAKLVLI